MADNDEVDKLFEILEACEDPEIAGLLADVAMEIINEFLGLEDDGAFEDDDALADSLDERL